MIRGASAARAGVPAASYSITTVVVAWIAGESSSCPLFARTTLIVWLPTLDALVCTGSDATQPAL
jgi:hypothetical protein